MVNYENVEFIAIMQPSIDKFTYLLNASAQTLGSKQRN